MDSQAPRTAVFLARKGIILFIGVCACLIGGQQRPVLAAEYHGTQQQLFEQMSREPTNYDLTSAFVHAATANGDYEAAIGALERLLYYNADLPLVKYELGALYYRLGSYDMAARYFQEALASPGIDDATKARIGAYLPDAQKQLQRSRLSGLLETGVRYQSNANYGPRGDTVRLGGLDLPLLPGSRHEADGNAYVLLGLSHDYDLEDGRGDVLESRLTVYSSQQFSFHDLDVSLFDLSVGVRSPIGSLPGWTIKPYIVGGTAWVGGARYDSSIGAGVQLSIPVQTRLKVEPFFEWRYRDFRDDGSASTTTFGSGNAFTGGFTSNLILSDDITLQTAALYRRGTAGSDFQSYDQWAGSVALNISFAPPIASSPYDWMISPFVSYLRTAFDAANPDIDPDIARVDDEWIGGIVLKTPLTDKFGLSTAFQYQHTNSNLPNYKLQNFSVMTGVTVRF
jgi:tetratricopeptide (TPR) repeat protein